MVTLMRMFMRAQMSHVSRESIRITETQGGRRRSIRTMSDVHLYPIAALLQRVPWMMNRSKNICFWKTWGRNTPRQNSPLQSIVSRVMRCHMHHSVWRQNGEKRLQWARTSSKRQPRPNCCNRVIISSDLVWWQQKKWFILVNSFNKYVLNRFNRRELHDK